MTSMQNPDQVTGAERDAAWSKGHVIPDRDPREYRADDFGEVMRFADFGDTKSEFGWDIDMSTTHRPVNWRNNAGLHSRAGERRQAYTRN